jgi:YHS domain-containing protein
MKLTSIPSTLAILLVTAVLGTSTLRADSGIPKSYPLKTCPVSGDKLGEHGKSVKVTAPDGTDVYLCCRDCLKDFKKNPAKYAKMVKDAEGKK